MWINSFAARGQWWGQRQDADRTSNEARAWGLSGVSEWGWVSPWGLMPVSGLGPGHIPHHHHYLHPSSMQHHCGGDCRWEIGEDYWAWHSHAMRKIRYSRLLEGPQRARWDHERRIGTRSNATRGSQWRSLTALRQRRKLRERSGGKERSLLSQLILHLLFLHFPLLSRVFF